MKIINRAENIVFEMAEGLLAIHPGLAKLAGYNVVLRAELEKVWGREVALISGGGSGHEPAHAGFVGTGMLSAAVLGEVFTSPSVASVFAAIKAVAGPLGALLIVKNYTGDRLNFGLAAEMARAEGIPVQMVIAADDVALAGSADHAGQRGIAGTIFLHKIAGAAAAAGKDLPQVAQLAQAVADNIGSMGVALSAGNPVSGGKPSFVLENEVELGLGIHGEPGVRRIPILPADQLVNELLSPILSSMQLRRGERVAVLLNNLGSTTAMELAVAARRILSSLQAFGLLVERFYAGTFMSSLDMAGISISLLRLDDERLKWLDAPTTAPAWPNVLPAPPGDIKDRTFVHEAAEHERIEPAQSEEHLSGPLARTVSAACRALIEAEPELTRLDKAVGDGDLGINMARAANTVLDRLSELPLHSTPEALRQLGRLLQENLGGSSGPLYGVLFLRAGTSLENGDFSHPRRWADAMLEGCEAVSELGDARVGDRTMLDALVPFAATLRDRLASGESLTAALPPALAEAESGAENTSHLTARRGRSSYLGARTLGWPDPGAVAATIWLRSVVEQLNA